MARLSSDNPPEGATSACRRCQRPAPPLDSPPSLAWEPILTEGKVSGVTCSDCLTLKSSEGFALSKPGTCGG